MLVLSIPETLNIVAASWMTAEQNLRNEIRDYSPNSDEEYITKRFHAEFAKSLSDASASGLIDQAFLEDLKVAFRWTNRQILATIARGLVATVTLHTRKTERITGGDIGLLVLRPQVEEQFQMLRVSDYRRGMLCQAKLRQASGKWGKFTQRQKKVLPDRLGFLGLLLYQYEETERRILAPFLWQVCQGMTFQQVELCLKADLFPNLQDSASIIQALGHGVIGTSNDDLIDRFISPERNPYLVIRVWWDDPRWPPPGPHVSVYAGQHQAREAAIKIRH